jgi:hypothetical protein
MCLIEKDKLHDWVAHSTHFLLPKIILYFMNALLHTDS